MSVFDQHLLSVVIWLPILGALVVLFLNDDAQAEIAKGLSLLIALATFAFSLPLYFLFDVGTAEMQFVERAPWIELFNIEYYLGIDGISMPFILLTAFLTVIVIIAGWQSITHRVAQYMAAFLVLEGVMNGVFASLDAILYYVFWEAMLIPMFIIIGIWGGERRVYATIKFFLYTLLGSLLMLVALLYLYSATQGSFSILDFHDVKLGATAQAYLFFAFFAAFAVKVPMFPVHTWLPDAHVEAPTGGSVILAAIMLKMGAYGFLRFVMPILPDASREFAWLIITLSLIAVVYIALVALAQRDMKKLIAYSSISHMGFVTLGFFIFHRQGIEGGIVQMVSHGFVSGALFLCVGVLYDRLHTRNINDYGGVANKMPVFAAFMMLFAMANSGLPGTSGFVGEFLVIVAAYSVNAWYAIFAATTLVFGAAYTLWMYKRVIFGPITNDNVATLEDTDSREWWVLALLALCVIVMGVWPNPLLEVMHASVDNLFIQMSTSKL